MNKNRTSTTTRSKFFTLTTFLIGTITGALLQSTYTNHTTTPTPIPTGPTHGTITTLARTPDRPTVHIDTQGRPITKRQLIEPFLIPNLTGVSVATFLPGQTLMPPHAHGTMHEIFYVLEGRGVFEVNGVEHEVEEGTLLHFAPGERHGMWVREGGGGGKGGGGEADVPLKLFVVGVAVGEKSKDGEN